MLLKALDLKVAKARRQCSILDTQYNLPDFFDLMKKESSGYYCKMCVNVSNGRFNPRQSKYKILKY